MIRCRVLRERRKVWSTLVSLTPTLTRRYIPAAQTSHGWDERTIHWRLLVICISANTRHARPRPWPQRVLTRHEVLLPQTDRATRCQSKSQARTHTHPFNGPFSGTIPGWACTRKVKPIWILLYWSKRQWVAVASAGPYASLHLAPDR